MSTFVENLFSLQDKVALVTGANSGIGYMAMTLTTALLTSQPKPMIFSDCGRRFVWGLLAGFLVTGCLPLIERFFGALHFLQGDRRAWIDIERFLKLH